MGVGRKIYYELLTGNIIIDTGERQGYVRPTTPEQDIMTYKELYSRVRESFSVVELPFGAYAQDFAECSGYSVNPETKTLMFSYPNPSNLEPTEPVYETPLSEKVSSLEQENQLLKIRNNALSERADFIEDVVAELAVQVYQ